jgi:hypothetical protein
MPIIVVGGACMGGCASFDEMKKKHPEYFPDDEELEEKTQKG